MPGEIGVEEDNIFFFFFWLGGMAVIYYVTIAGGVELGAEHLSQVKPTPHIGQHPREPQLRGGCSL